MKFKKYKFESFDNYDNNLATELLNNTNNITSLIANNKNNPAIIIHSLTDEELESREKAQYEVGFNAGYQNGLLETNKKFEDRINLITEEYETKLADKTKKEEIMQSLIQHIDKSIQQIELMRDNSLKSIGELSIALAEQLYNILDKENAKARIYNILEDHYNHLFTKPKLKIYVNEMLFDEFKHELEHIIQKLDSKTEIKMVGVSDNHIADIKIIWEDGVIKLDNKTALNQIISKITEIFCISNIEGKKV